MIDPVANLTILELALRGGCSGICLLVATRLFRRTPRFGVSNLGSAFCFCSAIYAVFSSPFVGNFSGPTFQALSLFATLNSVVFWWFATSLFDDSFRWNIWRLIPFVGLLLLTLNRWIAPDLVAYYAGNTVQQILIIAMMLHTLWLAISRRADDLVEPRRRFRPVFAFLVGMTGMIIAVIELSIGETDPQVWLSLLHATSLFGLALVFGSWIIGSVELFPTKSAVMPTPPKIDGMEEVVRRRLEDAMTAGAYLEEGLTIAQLSGKIAYPEYKVRQLINGALGFRNFSAFLNSYRIKDAKALLANPDLARLQVTQIAFELGYGSVATFNRAFKEAEGMTPSYFRKRAQQAASET